MAREIDIKPNYIQKHIHRILMLGPVSAFLAKVLHHADVFLLRLTNDRHTFAEFVGLPIILLTTTGAKSGLPRVVPLVGIVERGVIALVASSFGRKSNPGWYYNLKANSECTVKFNGRFGAYVARETAGDEYEHYWKIALTYYAGYDRYKQRAKDRHIPVMVLEPKK